MSCVSFPKTARLRDRTRAIPPLCRQHISDILDIEGGAA